MSHGDNGEEFFGAHCLVNWRVKTGSKIKVLISQCGEGPFMVVGRRGFPPSHQDYYKNPQQITIALPDGSIKEFPGSLFARY